MVLKDEIQKLVLQIQERKLHISNEEATKQSLIMPLIQALGYDIYNPLEVKPEYVADFAKKKGEKVDYCIYRNGKAILFIEAKSIHEILENHDTQLSRYFNSTPEVKFGIITNGIKYKFFTDLKQTNIMDPSPFFELNFDDINIDDIDILSKFCKDCFDTEQAREVAEELFYTSNLMKNIKNLFNNPTDEFIRFLIKDFNESRITSLVVEKFKPIVKKALTHTIIDIVKEGILLTESKANTPENIKSDFSSENVTPEKIITTSSEELKAYELIRSILANAGRDITQVKYKDAVSYFSVINHNVNGWFIRLFLDREPKFAIVRIPFNTTKSIPIDLKVTASGSDGYETKIFFSTIDDIQKISKIIIMSFDLLK